MHEQINGGEQIESRGFEIQQVEIGNNQTKSQKLFFTIIRNFSPQGEFRRSRIVLQAWSAV
jgi:hypothetical protein